MEALTGYHAKIVDISNDIVKHGFGRIELIVSSLSDDKIKITINAGRSWVFFIVKDIMKDIEIQKENML